MGKHYKFKKCSSSSSSSSDDSSSSDCKKKDKCIKNDTCCKNVKCSEFVPSDYSSQTGFNKDTDFVNKCYFYNSKLAIDGTLYNIPEPTPSDYPPNYEVPNLRFFFNEPNSGVPGPFDYNLPWSQWGGDEKYDMGPKFYCAILEDFGHRLIMTLQSKINILRYNKKANISAQDKMLLEIVNGSTQVFKWFAQLINTNGNPIPYNPSLLSGQLKNFEKILIEGIGPPEAVNNGVINVEYIISAFQNIANAYAPIAPDPLASQKLQVEIDELTRFLDDVLFLNTPGVKPIPLLTQKLLFEVIPDRVFDNFVLLYKIYNDDKCKEKSKKEKKCFEKLKKLANEQALELINTGRQQAAFFGIFYTAISFMDILLNVFNIELGKEAIPDIYRNQRVRWIHDGLKSWSIQNYTQFYDFDKAAAKYCEDDVYKTSLSLLTVCNYLALQISEVFRAFDKIVRFRNLYASLDLIPPPI
jgi:hypothetical protein